MAAALDGIFENDLQAKIREAKVLVVGAGGIGCELLKNLVLTGFRSIEIIDLDTIDVSNLNRQFLFHKHHVGKSKAAVAAESVLQFNPNVDIKYYHDSVIKNNYDVNFFARFNVVLNALDNLTARFHVNRMCLASNVPLIESGTSGYMGQVELIKKGITSCYECHTRKRPKDIASCTIRNTPSEPIHCIVWAKHLFNQLFGESDAEDISPDVMDPKLAGDPNFQGKEEETRISTRAWVQSINYDPWKLFKKLFHEDIQYLLKMTVLWNDRGHKKPTPLESQSLPDSVAGSSKEVTPSLKDMALWSIKECGDVFARTVTLLKKHMDKNGPLVWDKDDDAAMDFVAAASNIRAYIFQIPQKSRWEVKAIAGNIIPAIATTNAIIAGVVVLKALNVLQEQLDRCTSVFLFREFTNGKLLSDEKELGAPNPHCIVCKSEPVVELTCDTSKLTIKDLEELVLKKSLSFVAPDVRVKSTYHYIISSEEDETMDVSMKTLSEMNIKCGEILQADDFLQNYSIEVKIKHHAPVDDEPPFTIVSEGAKPKPKSVEIENKNGSTSKENETVDSDDELKILEHENLITVDPVSLKRKIDDRDPGPVPSKRLNYVDEEDDDDDCVTIN